MSDEIEKIRTHLSMPIVLIGMMGSGKTHMGRLIAKKLGWPFFDSDQLVEEKAGCSIADIFKLWGEDKFRDVEARTIQDLVNLKRTVIATGGGAVLNPDTADRIFSQSYSVWVHADIDRIFERVSRNENRPLLACENPKDVLQKLMQERQPVYEKAEYRIDSGAQDDNAAVQGLLNHIYQTDLCGTG